MDATALPDQARTFAASAHGAIDHRRKYTGEPYIEHPIAVAALVASVPGHTPEMLAAAYLHDVVEDTLVTREQLRAAFGPVVAELVEELTSDHPEGNRAARKARERTRLAAASPAAQTIKLADVIDNCTTIAAHDPVFARVYLQEKLQLLEVLVAGDAGLQAHARAVVIAALCALDAPRRT